MEHNFFLGKINTFLKLFLKLQTVKFFFTITIKTILQLHEVKKLAVKNRGGVEKKGEVIRERGKGQQQ